MSDRILTETAVGGLALLEAHDPVLHALLAREQRRQARTLTLVASCSLADPSVLACAGSSAANTTTEGYPGARFHAGCAVVDRVEALAAERARAAFGARYANVQPHSGTSANQAVMFALLQPGDALLGMDLDAGGHLSHGARASVSGRYFRAAAYGTGADGLLDYDAVRRAALEHRPRLIVAGASAYPRRVDWARFRAIADEAGALLLADISHVAGLVAAGVHPSPIDHAHVTTTSTYKQLCGPRGGLILLGRDADAPAPGGRGTLAEAVQRGVFPFFQGTPDLAAVAAKGRALALAATPGFAALAGRIVENARALAAALHARGWRVVTGGTDTHMVLVDVGARGATGAAAEGALESCGIVVNRNRIPGDTRPPRVGSGIRLGTNVLSQRGMGPAEMHACAALVDEVLAALRPAADGGWALDPRVAERVRGDVDALCTRFPLPRYPRPEGAGAAVVEIDPAVLAGLALRPAPAEAP
jgi:glycine hydroxymethyltransferase